MGIETINLYTREINITVLSRQDLKNVSPIIEVVDGAQIFPASGESIDISSNMQYTYKVVAPSTLEQEWTVKFHSINIPDYGAFVIKSHYNSNAMGIQGDLMYNDKYWDKALVDVDNINEKNIVKWQKWHLILDSEEDNLKYYKIRNLFSGLYITVADQENFEGANVYQDQLNTEDADLQLWRLNETVNGFEIINKKSELILTSQISKNGSGVIVLQPEKEGAHQQWYLQEIPLESYKDVEVQNFFRINEPGMGSVAWDQGNSIPLTWGPNNGKILWITEDAWDSREMWGPDVLRGDRFFRYNNSILIQPSKDDWNPVNTKNLTNPDTKHPDRVFQMMDVQTGMDWTWPGTGVEIDDKVYVYAGEGKGLEALASSLYILHQNEGTSWKVDRVTPVNVHGADGMVRAGDGYVYCYNNQSTAFLNITSDIFVRRFEEADPLKPWEVWDGSGWTVDESKKKRINDSRCTTNVAKFGDKYIMLSMDQGFLGGDERNVYLCYSSTPIGPWSEKVKVYEVEENINGGRARFYTPILHPYFTNDENELLFTISLNYAAQGQQDWYEDEQGRKCLNAYYYRLKAIRVPLSLIGL